MPTRATHRVLRLVHTLAVNNKNLCFPIVSHRRLRDFTDLHSEAELPEWLILSVMGVTCCHNGRMALVT